MKNVLVHVTAVDVVGDCAASGIAPGALQKIKTFNKNQM